MTQIVLDTLGSTDPVDVVEAGPSRASRFTSGVAKRFAAIRAIPHVGTYTGVFLVAVGAVLLAIAWGKVAGLTVVGLQMPYIVSAGFSGLGFVASGLTVISISAKHADARERSRQVTELHGLLAELRRVVEEDAR